MQYYDQTKTDMERLAATLNVSLKTIVVGHFAALKAIYRRIRDVKPTSPAGTTSKLLKASQKDNASKPKKPETRLSTKRNIVDDDEESEAVYTS